MYGGGVGGSNRLGTVIQNTAQTNWTTYEYNANGSMITRRQNTGSYTGMGFTTSEESFGYSYRELLRSYLSGNNEWRYRYSPSGEREQKRKYTSQQATKPLAWVYYQLGGSKEQMAVWHGLEKANSCSTTGTKVFLYPTEYNGSLRNFTTRPSGAREYRIADHIGNTRVIFVNGSLSQEFDYEPFGKQVIVTPASSGPNTRTGFIDKEKDGEDNLGEFGVQKCFE